jgi:hypothetical protein
MHISSSTVLFFHWSIFLHFLPNFGLSSVPSNNYFLLKYFKYFIQMLSLLYEDWLVWQWHFSTRNMALTAQKLLLFNIITPWPIVIHQLIQIFRIWHASSWNLFPHLCLRKIFPPGFHLPKWSLLFRLFSWPFFFFFF